MGPAGNAQKGGGHGSAAGPLQRDPRGRSRGGSSWSGATLGILTPPSSQARKRHINFLENREVFRDSQMFSQFWNKIQESAEKC